MWWLGLIFPTNTSLTFICFFPLLFNRLFLKHLDRMEYLLHIRFVNFFRVKGYIVLNNIAYMVSKNTKNIC